jgi:hypothetical protein
MPTAKQVRDETMTAAEIRAHRAKCDGKLGDLGDPCIICRPAAWDRWLVDPQGLGNKPCKRCGCPRLDQPERSRQIERVVLFGTDVGRCWDCNAPVDERTRQALTLEQCVALGHSSLER